MLSWLAFFVLIILHAVYWLVSTVTLLYHRFRNSPRRLASDRKQVPQHLAVLLAADLASDVKATESISIESVERVASWCRVVGIPRLTMYDYDGTLSSSASSIRERLSGHFDFPDIAVESDIEFPLTPPSSDDSDSRSNSPDANIIRPRLNVMTLEFAGIGKKKSHVGRPAVKRRRLTRSNSDTKPLTLHIVSRQSGKPTISRAASAILHSQRRRVSPQLSTYDENPGAMQQLLVSLLEGLHTVMYTCSQPEQNLDFAGDDGFPSPDLAIVHYITPGRLHLFPMELHGFPPWQMRLTEFYFDGHFCTDVAHLLPGIPGNGPCSPLEEIEFRRALDKFASAEMRLGK
ncbi:hypothetical protein BKA93DRAFT_173785 [Sparassis latifolia]